MVQILDDPWHKNGSRELAYRGCAAAGPLYNRGLLFFTLTISSRHALRGGFPVRMSRAVEPRRPTAQAEEPTLSDSEFSGVAVVKAANVYFEGNVTSRTVKFDDGSTKTLGIMLPGEYDFGTDAAEVMEILSGSLDVRLPDADDWQSITGGQSFEVPASSRFQVNIKTVVDYCCSYLE